MTILKMTLLAFACAQIAVAVANLFLVRLLHWRQTLQQQPLLFREVFQVHLWFISVTVLIFGVLTLRFAGEIAGGESDIALWLAGSIGAFWGVRAVIQVVYYSASHWRGKLAPTLVHIALLLAYSSMSVAYLWPVVQHA